VSVYFVVVKCNFVLQVCILLLNLYLVLVAADEKPTKIKESKSLSVSTSKDVKKSPEIRNRTESKPEKRGVLGEETSREGPDGGDQSSQEIAVAHHKPLVIEKVIHVHVPVPHPYPVEYVKHVPYPVQVPVPVVVNKPFPVPVPKPYHVIVEKREPYPVIKHVPHLVKVPVKVPVEVSVHKPNNLPVPNEFSPSLPHPVIKPVPLFINLYPGNQQIYKPEVNEGIRPEDSVPETHRINIPEDNYGIQAQSDNLKVYNIPETYRLPLPETYKKSFPETDFEQVSISQRSQYQNNPEPYGASIPEAYDKLLSVGISGREFSVFGGSKVHPDEGLIDSGYLSHDNRGDGHGFSYQHFKTC
jgi:hypothetical protein